MGKKLKCKNCGSIIESKYRHDFVWCECKSIYVDGGNDYTKFGGDDKLILIEQNGEFVDFTELLNKDIKKEQYKNSGEGI